MYCLKVREGTERIEVRRTGSAFVPTYLPAPSDSEPANSRKLIVPGYVFTLQALRLASPVPPEEWRIIEALSNSAPSFADDDGKIIFGPLTGLDDIIVSMEDDAVTIRAVLLGKARTFRIGIRRGAPESNPAPAEDKAPEKAPDQEESKMEFSRELMDRILADAEVNGIHAAAKAAGVPWQTVSSWARKAGRPIVPKQTRKPAEKAKEKSSPRNSAQPSGAEKPEAGRSPLEIENAVLRERVVKLEAKIQKLQNAINELMK